MNDRTTHGRWCRPDTKPITFEQANALVGAMRSGDSAARAELIERHVPLVIWLVARHIRRVPHLEYAFDDLVAEGILHLIKTVDRLARTKSEHAFQTIANAVTFALKHFHDDGIGGLSGRCRVAKRGGEIPTAFPVEPPEHIDRDPGDGDDLVVDFRPNYSGRDVSLLDAEEELLACCHDDTDRQIIALRMEEMSPREIADRLGYGKHGHSNVSERLREIYSRYAERQGWRPPTKKPKTTNPVGITQTKSGRWQARVGDYYIGLYDTRDEAVSARAKYVSESSRAV